MRLFALHLIPLLGCSSFHHITKYWEIGFSVFVTSEPQEKWSTQASVLVLFVRADQIIVLEVAHGCIIC